MRFGALVAAALLLSLTGCGRDDVTADKAAIADSLTAPGAGFAMTEDQADCVADGLVERIGVEQLEQDGVLARGRDPEAGLGRVEMSEADADTAADVMQSCADLRQIFTSALPDLPQDDWQCVEERLTDEVLHDYVAAVFRDEREQGEQRLADTLRDCVRRSG